MTPPWQTQEKRQWREAQTHQRSYTRDVVDALHAMLQTKPHFCLQQYATLTYPPLEYPLYYCHTRQLNSQNSNILITGGVHGYETSGVHGALAFMRQFDDLDEALRSQFNFFIFPCLSPWGYETINRWNPEAEDPNRSFRNEGETQESRALIRALKTLDRSFLFHIDLHETTNTDNEIFRPALAARDGTEQTLWQIPDGFYLVGDTAKETLKFQEGIIQEVSRITHIAQADEDNKIIGEPIAGEGIIYYACEALGLCASVTSAPFVTTTEVYPDSPKSTPENCVDAQVAAIIGGIKQLMT